MKIVSFLATAILSVSAVAGTAVYHDYDGALRGIALDNACVTATEVRTINAQRVCAQLEPVTTVEGDGNIVTDWVCKKWEVTQLAYPRAFERTVCTKYVGGNGEASLECVAWAQQADFLPASIKVAVVTDNGESSDFPGQTHTHTFPSCQ